jgi:hypothetical protein
MAYQARQRGLSQEAARWLDQAVQDLDEAVRDWRYVLLWLERLTSSDTPQACTEPLECLHALSEQAAVQQQRLQHLVGQMRQEQGAYRGGQAAGPALAATGSAASVAAAAGAQEEE